MTFTPRYMFPLIKHTVVCMRTRVTAGAAEWEKTPPQLMGDGEKAAWSLWGLQRRDISPHQANQSPLTFASQSQVAG